MRSLTALALLVLLTGCARNRATGGTRADIDPAAAVDERCHVEMVDSSLKSALKFEGARSRVENGFLVVEVRVRNVTGRNLPCEWKTTFQDKDGFDMGVTSNPWSPVVLNSNETKPLPKTAPSTGAEKAVFYIREAAPIRK